MSLSFMGLGESAATFKADEGLELSGVPVKISASATVAACEAGDDFCGLAIAVRDSYATVQLGGYVKLPYSGTAPSLGYAVLAADGAGGVKTVSTGGRPFLVMELDKTAKTVGIML